MNRRRIGPLPISERRERVLETRVPSVNRALDLLELIALSEQGLTLSDVSRKLRIPRSSVHYLIQSLAVRGYLERSPGARVYTLGLCATKLASLAFVKSQLKTICSPFLEDLAKKTGLTVQVGVLNGAEALVIHRVEVSGAGPLDSWVGRHFDLHCTALGKALIADLPEIEVERLFEGRGLPRHNPNTICSLVDVKVELAGVREKGYAVDNEEHELGVRCVAAPIFNYLGGTAAAVCVFSSAGRLPNFQIPTFGRKVLDAAREIARHLTDPLFLTDELSPGGLSNPVVDDHLKPAHRRFSPEH